jgi:hypothetical protein
LVLDSVNGSEGSPVLGLWDSFSGEDGWLSNGGVSWGFESENFFVLIIGPGGHEVGSNGEGVCWVSVDLGVFGGFGVEDFLSEHVFFLGSVGDTVLCDMLEEFVGGINLFILADIFESKGEGSFAERVHLFFLFINYKIVKEYGLKRRNSL